MPYKIIIDAGHGGSDPGATYNGRQEKDDTLGLAMELGELLKNAGYEVVYTRTSDVFNTPFEKATIGNNEKGDLFVSIHRNSGPMPNMYNGIQTLVYNDQGFKGVLARNINRNLTALGFEDKGVVERPNLVVLKRTKMPAVLVEAGFINSDKDNEIFDNQSKEVAQAIADGIIDTLNEQGISAAAILQYSVQVGAFRNQQLANNMAFELRRKGYPAMVVNEDGLYKVRIGYYNTLYNAVLMEQKLRSEGYNTFIKS